MADLEAKLKEAADARVRLIATDGMKRAKSFACIWVIAVDCSTAPCKMLR